MRRYFDPNDILTPRSKYRNDIQRYITIILNDKVLFSFYIYLMKYVVVLTEYQWIFSNKNYDFNLNTGVTNTLPNWTRGSKYCTIFWPPLIINDKVLFAFHIYLIRYIHDIRIISMMSWIVIMLVLTLPKAIPTGPPTSRYFDHPPQITDDIVLFVFHIYLTRSVIILDLY